MKSWEKLDCPHAVYRLYDSSNKLLYVGLSVRPMTTRLEHHRNTRPWFMSVVKMLLEWHPNWLEGYKAEAAAIMAENPEFNSLRYPPERLGADATRRANPKYRLSKPRGDGVNCPTCGGPKEKRANSYCDLCMSAYNKRQRARRLVEKQAALSIP